jgi:rubrerythrin
MGKHAPCINCGAYHERLNLDQLCPSCAELYKGPDTLETVGQDIEPVHHIITCKGCGSRKYVPDTEGLCPGCSAIQHNRGKL